jgi:hypothetical protein
MLNTVSYKIFTKAFNVHEKKRLELAKEWKESVKYS